MKPTDDEREAMAVRLEAEVNIGSGTVTPLRVQAAAMLRAMKGRVRVKVLEWVSIGRNDYLGNGVFNYEVRQVPEGSWKWRRFNSSTWYIGLDSEEAAKAAAQADYEARILAALEPAPGYLDGWNDAREAVADVARKCVYHDAAGTGFEEEEFDAAIRALTPPERPKP